MQPPKGSTWWLVLVAGMFVACGGSEGVDQGAQPEPGDGSADVLRGDASQLPTDARRDEATGHDANAEPLVPADASAGDAAISDAAANDSGDGTGATDASTEDAGSDFGHPCSSGSDCASGLCVKVADGSKVCTGPCTPGGCPSPDWRCGPAAAGGPDVCWPRVDFLCRPCGGDADCRFLHEGQSTGDDAACVRKVSTVGNVTVDDGAFCGVSCDANRPCSAGYDCITVPETSTKQCVRSDRSCPCRENWVGLGYETSCSIAVSGIGTCTGKRQCLSAGNPTACGAATPASETCNGVDDNCDGSTDEGGDALCANDLLSCTNATCRGALGCGQVLAPDSCLINGACYSVDATNPSDPCDQCKPSTSSNTWTHVGNACTIGNQCIPAGAPNPANLCEICDPLRSATSYSPNLDKCAINGSCYDNGATNASSGSCQVCDPATSRTAWTLKGNTCLIGGSCYDAGATNGATTCMVCDPSANTGSFSIKAGTCFINNTCYASNQPNGSNTCQRCLPCDANPVPTGAVCATAPQRSASKTQFTNMPGTTLCQPGDACYNDAYCSTGSCPARAFIQDSNELNNSYTSATLTRTSNECDDQFASSSGRLSGSGDDDWYRVTFTENTTVCTVDPSISANTNGNVAQLCVYMQCSSGLNDGINCQDGSVASSALSGAGYMGCCKTGINPSFRPEHDCRQPCSGFLCVDGDNDSADVRVVVQNLSSSAVCSNFSWTMHF